MDKPEKGQLAYIFGPMSGIENYNFPAFDNARDELTSLGYRAVSPADMDRVIGFDGSEPIPANQSRNFVRNAMMRDVKAICTCNFMVGLPGWQYSAGSRVEIALAQLLGLSFWCLVDGQLEPLQIESYPQIAERLVRGARQKTYSHPKIDFTRTAAMWSGLLVHKLNEPISAEEMALMMVLLKISRLQATPHHPDSTIDSHGYLITYEMLLEDIEDYTQSTEDVPCQGKSESTASSTRKASK